ncbi:MAG: hypothetical protein ACXVZU_04165 [Methanobacteriaceae archaeon]
MNQRSKDEILQAVNEYIADADEEKLFYNIERICKSVMFFGIPK